MICGVILAAGASRRMGRTKATLPVVPGGETFLARLAHTFRAGGVDDVIVVVAPDASEIEAEASRLMPPVRVAHNPEPSRGQLSSVLCALELADRPGVAALLVSPVDVPLLAPSTVAAIIEAWRRTSAPVVRPVAGSRHGHPVLFDRQVFDELRAADPGVGARAVVHAHRERIVDVTVADGGAFDDVDTPEDYARLQALTGNRNGE
jgi:molybdenum cofactor cytidylyltransferase